MPPRQTTMVVKDYKDFVRACDRAGRETKYRVRNTMRKVGEPVRADATHEIRDKRKGERTATGIKTVVRTRGIAVEQTRRKTTGRHPEFGAWQLRHALIPALANNEQRTLLEFDRAIDLVCDHFEKG